MVCQISVVLLLMALLGFKQFLELVRIVRIIGFLGVLIIIGHATREDVRVSREVPILRCWGLLSVGEQAKPLVNYLGYILMVSKITVCNNIC